MRKSRARFRNSARRLQEPPACFAFGCDAFSPDLTQAEHRSPDRYLLAGPISIDRAPREAAGWLRLVNIP
jgi:hypothetical protein